MCLFMELKWLLSEPQNEHLKLFSLVDMFWTDIIEETSTLGAGVAAIGAFIGFLTLVLGALATFEDWTPSERRLRFLVAVPEPT